MNIVDDHQDIIFDLSPCDVLMGRGAPNAYYRGNVSFRQLVAEYKPAYMAAGRHQLKQDIALQIYQEIGKRNGRFLTELKVEGLTKNGKSWVVAEPVVALEKVKQALRERDVGDVISYAPDSKGSGLTGQLKAPPLSHPSAPPQRLAPPVAQATSTSATSSSPSVPLQMSLQPHTFRQQVSNPPLSWSQTQQPFHSTSTLELLIQQRKHELARQIEQRAALLLLQEQEALRRQEEERQHEEQALLLAFLAATPPRSTVAQPPLHQTNRFGSQLSYSERAFLQQLQLGFGQQETLFNSARAEMPLTRTLGATLPPNKSTVAASGDALAEFARYSEYETHGSKRRNSNESAKPPSKRPRGY